MLLPYLGVASAALEGGTDDGTFLSFVWVARVVLLSFSLLTLPLAELLEWVSIIFMLPIYFYVTNFNKLQSNSTALRFGKCYPKFRTNIGSTLYVGADSASTLRKYFKKIIDNGQGPQTRRRPIIY